MRRDEFVELVHRLAHAPSTPDARIPSRTSFDGHRLCNTRRVLPSRSSNLTVIWIIDELIRLTDQSEEIGVERLKCLIELAALCNVTLEELMRQLGIKPVPQRVGGADFKQQVLHQSRQDAVE